MSRPLRILYSFPHPVGAPGIGTTALNQVRALAQAGADVTLVCTSLAKDVPDEVEVRETLRLGGRRIPHRVFGSSDRALAYHDYRVARVLRRTPDRYDVVHTWPQSAIETIAAARDVSCLSSREVPNTHTAHAYEEAARESQIVGVSLRPGHSHRLDPRRLQLEEREYAAADILMVPSHQVAETFRARGFDEARLGRHQYGYDPVRFNRINRVDSSRPFTAVFVGSGEPRKGLHYALESWSNANVPEGSRFLIAGGFAPGYRDYVARWLDDRSVRCLGFVNDVPSLLKSADVLLLPSVEEGSALVTYEAQACGCIPVVSSAAGALLPQTLSSFVHHPRDVQALTQHLQRVACEPETREELRREVAAWSVHLTWKDAAERMIEIYLRALAVRGWQQPTSI